MEAGVDAAADGDAVVAGIVDGGEEEGEGVEGVVGGVACAYDYAAVAASAVAGVADVAVQQPPSSLPPFPWV